VNSKSLGANIQLAGAGNSVANPKIFADRIKAQSPTPFSSSSKPIIGGEEFCSRSGVFSPHGAGKFWLPGALRPAAMRPGQNDSDLVMDVYRNGAMLDGIKLENSLVKLLGALRFRQAALWEQQKQAISLGCALVTGALIDGVMPGLIPALIHANKSPLPR